MIRRCQYCSRENNIPLLQFRLLFKKKVYHQCKCGYLSSYIAVTHIIHDTTDKYEKEYNKSIDDDKKGVWKSA